MWYTAFMPAGMMELVDMRDLGSRAFSVGVRVPMPAPRRSKLYIACSDFLQKSERAHAAAPPFQITTASLGCDLVLDADLKACTSKVFTLSTSEQATYRLLRLFAKVRARSCRCSSFSTAIRSAGFAVGFGCALKSWRIKSVRAFQALNSGNTT